MSVSGMLSVNFDPPQLEFLPDNKQQCPATLIHGQNLDTLKATLIELGLLDAQQNCPGVDCFFRINVSLTEQQLQSLAAAPHHKAAEIKSAMDAALTGA